MLGGDGLRKGQCAGLDGALRRVRRSALRRRAAMQIFNRMRGEEAPGEAKRPGFGEMMADLIGEHGLPYVARDALSVKSGGFLRHHFKERSLFVFRCVALS